MTKSGYHLKAGLHLLQNNKMLEKASLGKAENYLMIICSQSRKSQMMLIKKHLKLEHLSVVLEFFN